MTPPILSVSGSEMEGLEHGLKLENMELDLQSLFGPHVHSCTNWLRPRNPPPHPPLFGLI